MENLDSLRKKIKSIDKKISQLLKDRYSFVNEIGKIKHKHKLPILDRNREKDLISAINKELKHQKGCAEFQKSIFKYIYKVSRKIQRNKR